MLSPYKYRQIIENIVSNSLRAIEVAEQEKPKIKIMLHCMKEGCIVSIKDNGIGMTEDELKHCFEKKWTTFENQGGSGLGLYFVKKYIHEMNGTVHINSTKHKGTTVRIYLPIVLD
jgi:two-component system, sporulation sensor kinase D